ncbi:MAG: methyltransferase domain-containing protein [Chloroflexi bacterium]|nr:MAG: methyltransferase domain-containing protein [Chloroflexota bacterium]
MNDEETARLAQELIDTLKQQGGLNDPRLEAAFREVPRHIFLPGIDPERAYTDDAIAVRRDDIGSVISSSSQPSMMLLMLQQLRLQPGHNVLEIGAGTGYNAAIMQHIVGENGRVTSIEIDKDQADEAQDNLQRAGMSRVQVVHADGVFGYAPRAAYDRIIATVGVWDVPRRWVQQLKPNGILVAPIAVDPLQFSAAFVVQSDGSLLSRVNLPCGFIRLRGMAAGPPTMIRVGSSAMILMLPSIDLIDSVALHTVLSSDYEACHLGMRLTASDYWQRIMPFLMLYAPEDVVFATYLVETDQQAFGLEENGFALITQGSACFVPYQGHGGAFCFGSADAFLAMQACIQLWEQAHRPGHNRLRLRLIPITDDEPVVEGGLLSRRHEHYLHAWLESSS